MSLKLRVFLAPSFPIGDKTNQHTMYTTSIMCSNMLPFMALMTTIGRVSEAFPSSPLSAHFVCPLHNENALFAIRDEPSARNVAPGSGTDDMEECGEGFYKQTGPDGDYCVFDFDAAARAYGTGEQTADSREYWEALDSHNLARQKFGMEPLTPEEYVALQAQIHQIDETEKAFVEFDTNQDRVVTVKELREGLERILLTDVSEEQAQKVMEHFDTSGDGLLQLDEFVTMKKFRNKLDEVVEEERIVDNKRRSVPPDFLHRFKKTMFQNSCESNFDCERPEVCCDFHFKRMCCSSGQMGKDLLLEYATVPVPQNTS